ncbi:hypothetical protein VPNG_00314 [Cytospora leucostoma]|uniref:Succinate dehydrogenase assembly factor 3 n=1 Tax=Cytospora leucostoma TaxID=1230097 RepID=A0A423XP37_9PEZI|nr:hypothetical protein VPNG_00314 [Cytospora leucostoma]
MRASRRLLATATSARPGGGFRPEPMALLPPIPLYRRLLRAHRKHLPHQMRLLGDEYVKAEFRAHRKVDNPAHLIGFLTEWQLYAQKIEGDTWVGEKLDEEKIAKMSDQQIGQLYELLQAIKKGESGDSSV